jgi:hypothetical protein
MKLFEIHVIHRLDPSPGDQVESLAKAVLALTDELKAQRNREVQDLVGTLKQPTEDAAAVLKANQ